METIALELAAASDKKYSDEQLNTPNLRKEYGQDITAIWRR